MYRGFSTALTTTLVAGVIVLTGVVGYVEYGESFDEPSRQGSVSTTTTTASNTDATHSSEEAPDSWTVHQNQEYGFAVSYPGVYPGLQTTNPDDSSALTALQAKADQHPTLKIAVHNMNDFSAGADTGGTWPRYYDSTEDKWVARAGTESKPVDKRPVFSIDGYPVYRFETGNITQRTETYAIPVESQSLIIEASFVHDIDNSTRETRKKNIQHKMLTKKKYSNHSGLILTQLSLIT